MSRRDALKVGAVGGATLAFGGIGATDMPNQSKFKLKYAPSFGQLSAHAGNDLVDQLKFAADEGFHAWEDNGMKGKSVADQERLGKAMDDLGITMGVFVANSIGWGDPTLTTGDRQHIDKFVADCHESVEVAKRVGAKWMTVVPGTVQLNRDFDYQTATIIDVLRRATEIFEPHGLVMVLEPLNFAMHPNLFLTKMSQAFAICRAVNSPSCKILDDLFHQQVQEGNLIPNIDAAWSEIAYFQVGDNPGRKEPLTGEINYRNVFKHIHGKGFTGVVGMEHGKSQGGKMGERKLIDAYRWCDDF
ncbi:MAG: TIM barrel protein [Armatimonadetes bacterium]|nr:TIM barrel protein [Armatimonadota bacterium]